MKNIINTILFVAIFLSSSFAQEKIEINRSRIDDIVKGIKDSLNIPGIAIGIAVNEDVKYLNAIGYSNLETKSDLTTNSVWHICSVSKQFSTVACLKLVEENKLSLNDKISMYIDKLPVEYSEITIENLLSHTSGIKDYINEKNLYGLPWERVRRELISDSLNFKPGSAWRYSNTGFWLIAKIIEKVTGLNYYQYIEKNFFNKLNLTQTQKLSGRKIVNQRVYGYVYGPDGFENSVRNINEFQGQGDGGIMSTLNDLLHWNIALMQGKIIKKELVYRLSSPTKLSNGELLEAFPNSGINYGLGWFIKNIEGNKIIWTPGAGFGFSISSQYIPKYHLTIIVLCNKEQFLMADEVGFSIAGNILRSLHDLD